MGKEEAFHVDIVVNIILCAVVCNAGNKWRRPHENSNFPPRHLRSRAKIRNSRCGACVAAREFEFLIATHAQ